MEQAPNTLDDGALEAPTNGLMQPLEINPLLEEEFEVVRENRPNPQPPRDEIDAIMAQADDLQMYRDFEEYMYNGYNMYSDTDAPEDSDADYSDAD